MEQSVREGPGKRAVRSELMDLSNEIVRLYKELFGRGPTKVRSSYAGRDAVLCTVQDSLTPAERALAEMGEHQRLRDTRMFFQHASETQFREAAERVLGREVQAFVSGIDTGKDVSSEVFYLVPEHSPPGANGPAPDSA